MLKLVDFGLVKLMVPDETRTITVLQGRGTALYTPLEQYGGETGHTDARSDVYSLGATLYHLATNEPPAEAKQRFLAPDSLQPVRDLRPEVSKRTAEAIEWAMALHPDDRPADAAELRQALIGDKLTPRKVRQEIPAGWQVALRENRWLGIAALTLLLIVVMATWLSPMVPAF